MHRPYSDSAIARRASHHTNRFRQTPRFDAVANPRAGGFSAAERWHIADTFKLFNDNALDRMIIEKARLVVSGLTVGLHSTYRVDDQ